MKHTRLIAGLSIFCIVLFLLSFYFFMTRPLDVRSLPVRFKVGDHVGLEINSSALTFGIALPGTSSTRDVFIDNPYSFPLALRVYGDEVVSPYLSLSTSRIIVPPSGRVPLAFTLRIPSDATFGSYEGFVVFEFRRKLF